MTEALALNIIWGIVVAVIVVIALDAIRLRWHKIASKRYGGDKL